MARDASLIIRGGTLVDGTGAPPYEADIAIGDGRILEIGKISARAPEEIDAKGLIVTPGFVDIHTHYDAQATWSSRLLSSSINGVTTALLGNCGVGFAPCRPDRALALCLGRGVLGRAWIRCRQRSRRRPGRKLAASLWSS